MIGLYQTTKEFWWRSIKTLHPSLYYLVFRHRTIVKYIFAGGTAACTDLVLLAFFKEWFGVHYLLAATFAFAIAFFVSFVLQKYWTFGHTRLSDIHSQLGLYFGIAVTNLGINALLMYLFVDFVHLWYLFAQILAGGLIALMSFFMYRRFVFVA